MIGRIIWTTHIINFFLDVREKVIDLFVFLIKKLNKHISRSNIKRIDFDPIFSHIKKVKEVLEKCLRKHKMSKELESFTANNNAQSGKTSPFYLTYKPNILVKVLTAGFHTVIENLAIFLEKHCIKLTKNRPIKINDSYHLLDIPEDINVRGIPDNSIFVSLELICLPTLITKEVDLRLKCPTFKVLFINIYRIYHHNLETCLTNKKSLLAVQNFIR